MKSVAFIPVVHRSPAGTMPDGTEEDVDETPDETGGTEGQGSEEPTRPPEGLADEGTTVGAWDWRSPSGYWRISAILLAAVALVGIALNAIMGPGVWVISEELLVFDWPHNVLHVVLAAIAIVFGFTGLRTSGASKPTAGVIGVVYLALGVAGFFGGFVDWLDGLVGLHLEIGENILHILLGAWGAFVGFVTDDPY